MVNVNRLFASIVLGLFFVGAAAADTLELKNGKVLQGKYLGGTQVVLRFEVNGEVQTFNTNEIVALTFTSRSEEHTSELQSLAYLVCRLLLEKKKKKIIQRYNTAEYQ